MYEPNTMIQLVQGLRKNRLYVIDVTSKEIYSHYKDFSYVNAIGAVCASSGMLIGWNLDRIPSALYLNNASFTFKLSLGIMGILLGFLGFWFLQKKQWFPYTRQREEYFKRHPRAEKISDSDVHVNVTVVAGKAFRRVVASSVFLIALLGVSVFFFIRFLDDSNLITYFWSLGTFLLFALSGPAFKSYIFIIKFARSNGISVWD